MERQSRMKLQIGFNSDLMAIYYFHSITI